jgi:hypothetical protein
MQPFTKIVDEKGSAQFQNGGASSTGYFEPGRCDFSIHILKRNSLAKSR